MFVLHQDSKEKKVGNGISRRILAHSEKLMPCEIHLKKEAIIEEHRHPHEQCSYIVSGSCRFTVGNESKVVGAGDSVYIPPEIGHKVEVLEDSVVIDIFTPMREDFLQ